MDQYTPLEWIAYAVLFLVAMGLGYWATLCAAFRRGRKTSERDLVENAVENPTAFEHWLTQRKIEHLEQEIARRDLWGINAF